MAQNRARLRWTAFVLGLTLFMSYAWFYQAGGWNQNTRFALVRAILEQRTILIDTYSETTGDRSLWEGHYYSDKAPGASFIALAPVAAAQAVLRSRGIELGSRQGVAVASYVATLATSSLFTVVAALGIYWLSIRWRASREAALFAAATYGLATPAWAYATVFVGHSVTSGLLMAAFWAAVALPDNPKRVGPLAWAVGLLCGLAVVTEFPAAPAVLVISLLAVSGLWSVDRTAALRAAVIIAIGGGLMAVILGWYHNAAFGSPFQLGYGNEDNSEGARMREHGLFGIGTPTWHVAYEVLLGWYRGLLPLAPLVALAPLGLALLARVRADRRAVAAAATIAGYYLLLNVSYTYWEGGWFIGPRHLLPGLGFVALGLAPLWDSGRVVGRAVLIVGWLWGAALSIVSVSTTPQPPSNIMRPVQELLWPAFAEGDLSINAQTYNDYGADPDAMRHHPDAHAAWNLGEVVGLRGLTSLLPLLALWVLAALLLL